MKGRAFRLGWADAEVLPARSIQPAFALSGARAGFSNAAGGANFSR
ncbi:hypothetical protein B8V81_0978 [Paenibacillus pasadenensis]|uniref:Uncharacterized protein n=1 Tax=Paenibacillus pasadenensis TaxID=217090 RepID=A0A2N5N8U6_9BACL|nr:hypothetical protein B8V81_0978 [Paenibacillus pasadenensis]